jgi:hypothetical protein
VDTWIGMALSNLVALAIMLTAGATLHVAGKTDIDSSQMAAEALRPIDWLFGCFRMSGRPGSNHGRPSAGRWHRFTSRLTRRTD